MSKKDLEQYIRDNRSALDVREPNASVWSRVSQRLNISTTSTAGWLWKAAAIFFMVSTIYLLPWDFGNSKETAGAIDQEFAEIEQYYFSMISEKKAYIAEWDHDMDPGFDEDWKRLNAMYLALKEEYGTNPSEQVKDALILNLLVRIEMLNKQVRKLTDENISGKQSTYLGA